MVVCTLVIGLFLLLLVTDHLSVFTSHLFIPVMTVLQADALFVCRRGLAHYVLNRRQHASLDEYLRGNGASEMEIQQPCIKRAFVPVLSQLLLVGLVFVPSLLAGLLVGHVSPLQATAFLAALTAGAMCSSMLSLLLAIYIYFRLKK